MRGRSYWVSLLFFFSMVLLFVGERLIGAGSWRWLTAVGAAFLTGAIALRLWRAKRATEQAQQVERAFVLLYGVGALAVLLYAVQSDLATHLLPQPLSESAPRLAVALAALWPALWLVSAMPILLTELAYGAVVRAPRLETGRLYEAMRGGLGLAAAIVFAFSAAYIASERDKKLDLSFFRTARPGDSTHKLVRTLDQPVQVGLFFPPANDVHEQVATYFDDLTKESKQLEVKHYDHAVDVKPAKDLGVSGNGMVVIARGGRHELLSVGLELESARTKLRDLDKEVQKLLLKIARPGRTVYMTVGHGERTTNPASETDKRTTIATLRKILGDQGYAVRDLGAADGLATDVPSDAAAVLVLGPTQPFLKEEATALERYLGRAGRLFLALDPEPGVDFKDLLDPLAIKFSPTVLCNDQNFARVSFQESDHANIATAAYSSHPSVTTLSQLGMRAPVIMMAAGGLEEVGNHAKELSINFTIHAQATTWNDLNHDYRFSNAPETRKAWELAAAVTRKKVGSNDAKDEARAVVVGDSDVLSDGVIQSYGNPGIAIDGMRWLLGEEAIAGEITSEADVPVAHTKKQDVAWFYSTIFIAPALTLGVGFVATRRRRRATKEAV